MSSDPPAELDLRLESYETVGDVAGLLRRLKRRHARRLGDSELTVRELSKKTGYAVGAVGAYLKGGTLPPTDRFDVLIQLLGADEVEQRAMATIRDKVADAPKVPNAVAGSMPRQLLPDTTGFVGRLSEIEQIDLVLRAPQVIPVVAITGMAGVGKTSLAVRWGHENAGRFPDGCLFADLRGFGLAQPRSPEDVLGEFLRSMGLTGSDLPVELQERAARYRTLTHDRRMLIILDNARDAEQIRPLLPGSRTCLVIVTSRTDLASLTVHPGARLVRVAPLPIEEAVALLGEQLGRRVAADSAGARRLALSCGQLPLALRITAALAHQRADESLDTFMAEIASETGLTRFSTGDDATSVRNVFGWSYRHLDDELAGAFRLFGAYPGRDIGVPAFARLVATDTASGSRILDALTGAHLLQRTASGRYAMHDLLRRYAVELAEVEQDTVGQRAAMDRLLGYYLYATSVAMDAIAPLEHERRPEAAVPSDCVPSFTTAAEATTWLDAERGNLVAAATFAADSERPEFTGDLSIMLGRYLDVGAHYEDARVLHSRARHVRPDIRTIINLGTVYARLGDYDAAVEVYQDALGMARAAGDRASLGRILLNLGSICWLLGRLREALDFGAQALECAQETGDETAEALALVNLANVHKRLGQYEQAIRRFDAARQLAEAIGDRSMQSAAISGLGDINVIMGNYPAALDQHDRALTIARLTSDHQLEITALNSMGVSLLHTGRLAEAVDHHRGALALAQAHGDRYEEAKAHEGLGAALTADQIVSARQHLQQALRIYVELGVPEAAEVEGRLGVLPE